MKYDFNGKIAIVTGGTSGLGYGISKAFLEAGAKVIAFYKSNDEKAKAVSDELNELGNFKTIKVDVSDENKMKEVFNDIEKVDFLINCAGISNEDAFIKLPMDKIKEVFETLLFGKMIACKCAYPLLVKSDSPRVINIASRFATRPLDGAIPLTSAEAGIVMFTKNLALEWAKDKINVNAVSPSLTTNTGSYYAFYTDEDAKEVGKNNPAGRLGKLEDTANLVLFLCTKEAEYINGENINVNGGILLK